MRQWWRVLFAVSGLVSLVLTFAFFTQAPWATRLWPWDEGRLTCIFIASIAAAIALPNLWIAFAGRAWAVGPGAVNLAVSHLGMAGFLLVWSQNGSGRVLVTAAAVALAGIAEVVAVLWSSCQPIVDSRPTPFLVRASFLLFAVVLVVTGYFLVIGAPHIFPWPLKSETSVLIGCIFWGAALYFAAGVIRPVWENACGQLLGFLAYDLVLIVPYLMHFQKVKPAHALSLKVYVAVLVYSGLLAAYYLFIHPPTRFRLAVRGTPEQGAS